MCVWLCQWLYVCKCMCVRGSGCAAQEVVAHSIHRTVVDDMNLCGECILNRIEERRTSSQDQRKCNRGETVEKGRMFQTNVCTFVCTNTKRNQTTITFSTNSVCACVCVSVCECASQWCLLMAYFCRLKPINPRMVLQTHLQLLRHSMHSKCVGFVRSVSLPLFHTHTHMRAFSSFAFSSFHRSFFFWLSKRIRCVAANLLTNCTSCTTCSNYSIRVFSTLVEGSNPKAFYPLSLLLASTYCAGFFFSLHSLLSCLVYALFAYDATIEHLHTQTHNEFFRLCMYECCVAQHTTPVELHEQYGILRTSKTLARSKRTKFFSDDVKKWSFVKKGEAGKKVYLHNAMHKIVESDARLLRLTLRYVHRMVFSKIVVRTQMSHDQSSSSAEGAILFVCIFFAFRHSAMFE